LRNVWVAGKWMGVATAAIVMLLVPGSTEAQRAEGMLSLEGARLYYEVVGTGDPVIVVHGGPGLDHAYLQPGLDALGALSTIVYYDQRGTGRSDGDLTEESINLDTFVEDIDALRQTLGYDRVTVLGHSFGALIALEYAFRFPESLRALILMNPVEPGSRYRDQTAERQESKSLPEDREEMEALRQSEAFSARDAATLSQVYRVAFRQVLRDREQIDQLDLDLSTATARNGQDVGALLGASFGVVDWWDRLGAIEMPTLVLHGRYDAPPIDMSRELAEAFPLGTFEVLDSGHFPYVEDRSGLFSAVAAFLAGLE